ncbi:hypothetical protein OSTOST_01245, partial [Ostertagia ostertagi]
NITKKIRYYRSCNIVGSILLELVLKGFVKQFLQAYLAEFILPVAGVDLAICHWIYNNSKGYGDLFAYEACIRDLLGTDPSFGKIKILPKGTAWVRDNWMTNSKWSDERDFFIHNWKLKQLRTYSTIPL